MLGYGGLLLLKDKALFLPQLQMLVCVLDTPTRGQQSLFPGALQHSQPLPSKTAPQLTTKPGRSPDPISFLLKLNSFGILASVHFAMPLEITLIPNETSQLQSDGMQA